VTIAATTWFSVSVDAASPQEMNAVPSRTSDQTRDRRTELEGVEEPQDGERDRRQSDRHEKKIQAARNFPR
jgi:hypothetical protein